jgi:hypothetical protein
MITDNTGQLVSLVASTDQALNVLTVPGKGLPTQVTGPASGSTPAGGLLGWILRKAGLEH